MKHFALKALLGISCMTLVSIAPLTANDEPASQLQVDAVTCATPPARPAKSKLHRPLINKRKRRRRAKAASTVKKTKATKAKVARLTP